LAAARVLEKDVGMAVAIEIVGPDGFPSRPGIEVHYPTAD
jgi:hypothetical protein